MPIHDVGYRAWDGPRVHERLRWWVIAQTGIRLAWKSQWLRRMLFVAWLPAIGLGFVVFIYERSLTDPGTARTAAVPFLMRMPQSAPIVMKLEHNPESARREVWGLILLTFFRIPQSLLMVLLVGIVAPSLIANDLRSRAYLLYFSRPIERLDYLIGKSFVVWTYLFLVTTVPALTMYLLGVGLSPNLGVVAYTWDLPLRILASSLWLIIPTTAMALCYSSLTTESRYASYAWFATWALGWVAYTTLNILEFGRFTRPKFPFTESHWSLVSLYHSLGRIQSWIFGLEPDYEKVLPAMVLIFAITVVTLIILFRRVTAPLRI